MKRLLLVVLCFSACANFCYANESISDLPPNAALSANSATENFVAAKNSTSPQESALAETPTSPTTSPELAAITQTSPPKLVAPAVEDPKMKKHPVSDSKKIDLKAVIFDPNADFKANAEDEGREMTKLEEAQYTVHEALHCEVSTPSTKGLLEDKMRIKFKKGPVESIAPWFDYSGNFSNLWNGDNYANTLYGNNFMDFGINGKFRNGKTAFRVMFNYGKYVEGLTYFQAFPADIFISHQLTPHNKLLVGYTRDLITKEGGESPLTVPFFARSQTARTYGNVRALGVKASGDYDLFDYALSFNSSGRFFTDFFPGPEFTGFVDLKPLGKTDGRYGKLTMGGGLNAGNAQSHYVVGSTYLGYEYKRLKWSAEYASADGSNGSTGFTSARSEGYNTTLAYRVTPKLQALVRYDKFDPNKDRANDMRTEYTAGLNYFIKGQALKLMLNYVYYTLENGNFGSKIMVGTQVVL